MNQDKQVLRQICKMTEIGQCGIRAVMDSAQEPALRQALNAQLREYDAIHHQADKLLADRGERAPRIPVLAQMVRRAGHRLHTGRYGSSSAIAERMISGNTRGMVQSIRESRACHVLDPKISGLSNRLLQTELANIEQMKPFL